MSYSPITIANYLFDLYVADNKLPDRWHIIKMIYFAHGWHLVLENKPLINETIVGTANRGPYIDSLTRPFYGKMHKMDGHYKQGFFKSLFSKKLTAKTKEFLGYIYKLHSAMDSNEQSRRARATDGAWDTAFKNAVPNKDYELFDVNDLLITVEFKDAHTATYGRILISDIMKQNLGVDYETEAQ